MALRHVHTNYRLLKLALLVQVEELASIQGKDHTLIVLLELVVDLCRHKCGQFAVREGFILV